MKMEIHCDFKITKTNHIIMSCKINGVEGNFIIDSGASNSCIDSSLSSKFKLKTYLSEENGNSATNTISKMYISKNNILQIEELLYKNFEIFLFDMTNINETFENYNENKIDGIIGNDILNELNASINYKKKEISLEF